MGKEVSIKAAKLSGRMANRENVYCQEMKNALMVQFNHISSINRDNVQIIYKKLKQHFPIEKNVVLDMQGVQKIDAHGLALILHLNTQLAVRKKQLILSNPSHILQKILLITEIDRLVKIKNEMGHVRQKPVDPAGWYSHTIQQSSLYD